MRRVTGKGVAWLVAVPLLLMFLGGGIAFWIAMPEIYLGQIWFGVGVLLALIFGGIMLKGREAARIAREGIPGVGRVLELTETNMQVNNRPVVKVRLQIEAPGVVPFEVSRRLVVPFTGMAAFSSGTIPVVLDRKDHSKVVVDLAGVSAPRRADTSMPRDIGVSQHANAAEARLAALEELRDKDMISTEEYRTKRSEILDSI